MSTSSIHLDRWKRGLQDRIHGILVVTIIHHLVEVLSACGKFYTIPWSPPFPISSSFTSWLRDSPRRMLYPNESSEPWLPRTVLYSLVSTPEVTTFGAQERKHMAAPTHSEEGLLSLSNRPSCPRTPEKPGRSSQGQPHPRNMHRDSKCQSRQAGVPSIAPSGRSYGVVHLDFEHRPEPESAKTHTFMHVTTDMWLPIGTPEGRKHHHADSDMCFSNMQICNVDILIPTPLQSARTAGCLHTASSNHHPPPCGGSFQLVESFTPFLEVHPSRSRAPSRAGWEILHVGCCTRMNPLSPGFQELCSTA